MNRSKQIALYGVWASVIFVMLILETFVFSTVLPVAPPAVFSLATTFSFCVYDRWKTGLAGGLVLGICSLIVAFMIGNAYFIFPWISVLPRAVAGVIAYFATAGVRRLTANKTGFAKEVLPYAVGGGVGVLTNTLLVLTMLSLTTDAYSGSFLLAMKAVVATNTLFELVAGTVLVPVIVKTMRKASGETY